MPARLPTVDPERVAQWCVAQLGSPPVHEIFRSGHLSTVIGLRLADGRDVVVKIRPRSPRLPACVEVQRHLFAAGYRCPRPLTGVAAFGNDVATAEAYVPGGSTTPGSRPEPDPARAAQLSAAAFARLIELAPRPDQVASLQPVPSWTDWNHSGDGLWPLPDDPDVNLNAVPDSGWIDEAGRRARDRLRAGDDVTTVIGHGDWLAGNVRWIGDELLVVHDWDSVLAADEAVLAGFAAALFSVRNELATVEESSLFLSAYGQARGRELAADELQRAWAAGAWTRAFDAKYQHAIGAEVTSLLESEARERLRRAGMVP